MAPLMMRVVSVDILKERLELLSRMQTTMPQK